MGNDTLSKDRELRSLTIIIWSFHSQWICVGLSSFRGFLYNIKAFMVMKIETEAFCVMILCSLEDSYLLVLQLIMTQNCRILITTNTPDLFLISNFCHVLYVICFLLGNSPASELYIYIYIYIYNSDTRELLRRKHTTPDLIYLVLIFYALLY
jgi:hypothetical protein